MWVVARKPFAQNINNDLKSMFNTSDIEIVRSYSVLLYMVFSCPRVQRSSKTD